jgi:hypothetical protein
MSEEDIGDCGWWGMTKKELADARAAVGCYFGRVRASVSSPETIGDLVGCIRAKECEAPAECPGLPVRPRAPGGPLYCRRCWALGLAGQIAP